LLRLKAGGGVRFRCHTGHAFTADALLAELTESVEGVLWNAVRAVQESSLLMEHVAAPVRESGDGTLASVYERKAAEARGRADLVRRAVMGHETLSGETLAGAGPGT
jgi:two-component system chemotaxis response regulator CheB